MKIFLTSLVVACLLASTASLVLTRLVQKNAQTAFSAQSARPVDAKNFNE